MTDAQGRVAIETMRCVAAIAYILNSAKRDRENEAQAAHRMKDHAIRSTICIGCIEPGSARESVHSPPIRAPFSATERFINKTKNVTASITTANSQKQSKYASADAC